MSVKFPSLRSGFLDFSETWKTPCSSCPLDRLTMDVNRRQSVNTTRNHREILDQERDGLARAEVVSSSLAKYGKRLFDDAVCRIGRSESGTNVSRRRHRTWHYGTHRCYSGPTNVGSPLYNKRAKLMNEIRTRAKTATKERFNHERSHALPDIEKSINKYSNEFRVVWSCDGIQHRPQDTLLVRIGVDNYTNGSETDTFNRSNGQNLRRLESEGSCSKKSESMEDDNNNKSPDFKLADDEQQICEEQNMVVEPRDNIQMESIGHAVEQTTIQSLQAAPLETRPKTAPKEPANITRQKNKKNSRKLKSAEVKPPEDDEDMAPTFTCWVDDVTVSSITPPDDTEQYGANAQNDLASGVAKISLDKNVEIQLNGECQPVSPADGENIVQADDTTVISLHDIEELEWTFPDFVCPSSEEKSKEVAIKQWLLNTSFTAADKSVPLI